MEPLLVDWQSRATASENPRTFLLAHLLADDCPVRITVKKVHDLVAHVQPHDEHDPVLRADLFSLRESRGVSDLAPVPAVQWVYFATQACHLHGVWVGTQFFMKRLAPIHAYSAHNVPCPYIWLDLSAQDYQLNLIKHSFPDTEFPWMFRVTMHYSHGLQPQRYAFDLRHCTRCPTVQPNSLHLTTNGNDQLVLHSAATADQDDRARPMDYLVILSTHLMYSQTILCRTTGQCSIYSTFLH